jgi:hypothetical protein
MAVCRHGRQGRRTLVKTVVLLTGVLMASGCGGVRATAFPAPPTGSTLPPSLTRLVAARWSGARVETPTPAASCTPPDGARAAARPFTTGDFNGDGATDVALWAVTPQGPHLAVAIARLGGYTLHEVTAAAAPAVGPISTRSRAERYHRAGSTMDWYFGADTLVVSPCGAAPVAYLWTGFGFDPVALAPTTPASGQTASGAAGGVRAALR